MLELITGLDSKKVGPPCIDDGHHSIMRTAFYSSAVINFEFVWGLLMDCIFNSYIGSNF